jgi:2-desacetyl-2-hydroxyethyl bacteriochlorophyllide A dehydrogenase
MSRWPGLQDARPAVCGRIVLVRDASQTAANGVESPPTAMTAAIARALWTIAPDVVELRDEEVAAPKSGEVLIETLFSGISRGTEGLILRGAVPESEWARMRAPFQCGEFPGPVKYGYSNVGRVVAGEGHAPGTLVFTLFPHQSRFVVDAKSAHPISESVPAERAVLAANMETALNAVWDAAPLPGDRVTIVGAGVLGCLVLSLLSRYPAIDIEVVDVLAERTSVITALGGRAVTPKNATTGRDLLIHTSASAQGLETALGLCCAQGTVLELSWYGSTPVTLALGAAFHSQRLALVASQVGTVSPNKPGWTHADRLRLALRLLDDPRLDALLAPAVPFEDLPTRFAELVSPEATSSAPGLLVRYR